MGAKGVAGETGGKGEGGRSGGNEGGGTGNGGSIGLAMQCHKVCVKDGEVVQDRWQGLRQCSPQNIIQDQSLSPQAHAVPLTYALPDLPNIQ